MIDGYRSLNKVSKYNYLFKNHGYRKNQPIPQKILHTGDTDSLAVFG